MEAGFMTVKAEVTFDADGGGIYTSESARHGTTSEPTSVNGWSDGRAFSHNVPSGVNDAFSPRKHVEQEPPSILMDTVVKTEYASNQEQWDTRLERDSTAAGPRTSVKVEAILKDSIRKFDTDAQAYLNFDTEVDRKVKVDQEEGGSSRESSAEASTSTSGRDEDDSDKVSRQAGQPISIAHLPRAEKEAMATFEELKQSHYQNKQMGLSHQQEDSMTCDCTFDPDTDNPDDACGEHSGCINRLTQVECLAGDCRCGDHCQNQRFQKRQYAKIDIVKTEKKGFGVRAREPLEKDAFVYEYVGDIIGEKAFQKRMRDYFDDGIEHFYFMMLQKDEFLDATKRGGRGRFLNHSCAPNCYVAKWVVGRRLRMGIFTKRAIEANEELTFNYNVDRYGHDAQVCYCGEPNCVGFIGGKTQTDIGGMDDLYLDALGILDAVNALGLRGSKKNKGKKLDEDYFPELTPIPLEDVHKVASAVRQAASNRRIVSKLLSRINLTEDIIVQRSLLRLHGFSLMSTVLYEYPDDSEIIVAVLEILKKWPLITRNKLISTNIEPTVMKLAESETQPEVSESAQLLLQMWQALEVGYRIPKSMQETIDADGGESRKRPAQDMLDDVFARRNRLRLVDEEQGSHLLRSVDVAVPISAPRYTSTPRAKRAKTPPPLPPNWELLPPPRNATFQRPAYLCLLTKSVYEEYPSQAIQDFEIVKYQKSLHVDVNAIIAKARKEAEEKAAQAASIAAAEEETARLAKKRKQEERIQKESQSKEKKLYRLFSTVVIKTMSKYKKYLDSDQFKKRAKEVCQIMCEKERKSSHFQTDKYDSLSPEKESKLKKYVKDFMTKLLARKGIKVSVSTSSTSTPSKDKTKSVHGHRRQDGKSSAIVSDRQQHFSSSRMSLPTPDTPSNEGEDANGGLDIDEDADEDDDLINELVDSAGNESSISQSASAIGGL